jgi:peptidyl-prolyl cis-trans isomerase B (cyclophilin B)
MNWSFRAVLSFTILAIIAACGQQGTPAANKPITPSTEARPLAKVAPAQRADHWKTAPQMTVDPNRTYVATITTSKGDIVVSLDAKSAPQTVNNFVFLANQGFYDGLTFHRVEPGFVIQGGDPQGNGRGGPGYTVPGEFKLKHIEGAIAMARLGDQVNPKRDSSGSQFYITLAATPFLDGTYTVFGQVTEGMDSVKKIAVGDAIQKIVIGEQ